MAIVSFGDMAQSFLLRSQNARLRADLGRQSQELSTGIVADLGARVAGDFSPLAGIERSLRRIDAFRTTTNEAAFLTETMQSALGSVGDLASSFAPGLLLAAQTSERSQVDAVGSDARSRFAAALSRLNTQVGDRSLFAGTATDGPAVADAATILTALTAAVAGATTAQDVAQAVSDWFDDPAGYGTVGYLGNGDPLAPVTIGEGETVSISASANDPELRDMLKGLASAALLDEGVLAGDVQGRADLARIAGEKMMTAQTGWTGLQARLGIAQERITEAQSRNSAEASALEIARTGILAVDPYDAATALQQTQTQLETLYSITARISNLSIVDYL